MAKLSLHFDTETEDKQHILRHINGPEAYDALADIWEQCFRPRYKHGYEDEEINKYLEDERIGTAVNKVVEYIENKYKGIVNELEESL